ncbi:MAG: hypothetical protein CSA21_03175 [Deltaproteobacteria bacterium]|nr:MAG: hypothetical protein CSA21_03175 [Deltaproteobacteria bacterium]
MQKKSKNITVKELQTGHENSCGTAKLQQVLDKSYRCNPSTLTKKSIEKKTPCSVVTGHFEVKTER